MKPRARALLALEIAVTLAIVAGLWLCSEVYSSYAVARMSDVMEVFADQWFFDDVTKQLLPTMIRLAAGFVLGSLLGIAGGLLLGASQSLRLLANPMLEFARSIPPVALIPVAIVVLGVGETTKVSLVAVVAVWPVLLNVTAGVIELDQTLADTGRAFRLSRWQRFRFTVAPAVGARAFAGMQVALNLSFVMVVAVEYLNATEGLGHLLNYSQVTLNIPDMWSTILMIGLIGLAMNLAFSAIQRRVLYWAPSGEGQSMTDL